MSLTPELLVLSRHASDIICNYELVRANNLVAWYRINASVSASHHLEHAIARARHFTADLCDVQGQLDIIESQDVSF